MTSQPIIKQQRLESELKLKLKLKFRDTKSIREQAEPYRLGTAKFPIDALTSSWTVGSNRTVSAKHAEKLCRIFVEQGLRRKSVENHLLVACTRSEVEKMKEFVGQGGVGQGGVGQGGVGQGDVGQGDVGQGGVGQGAGTQRCGYSVEERWPSFDDWVRVNGTKAELIAGQHRVEALKLYLQRKDSTVDYDVSESESWWVCEMYDKGKKKKKKNYFYLFLAKSLD
jgi:hypothetical protein